MPLVRFFRTFPSQKDLSDHLRVIVRIPDDKIDEVRNASDIVDVISAYVMLKKRGKNYIGRCPFHQEKTPSFNVSQEKQMYYCFGCSAGGNVFTFLMQHDKISFLEAVRTLADRAGIALPTGDQASQAQAGENEALYAACRLAGLFYYDTLMHSSEGKIGLAYFRSRGFTDETIKKFGLGYSPNAWDGLLRRMAQEGIDPAVLDRAGLVVRRDDKSGYYDRFRGRAMFPIFTASGRGVAFGARKLREDDQLAKYINSPETPIYTKSRTLYGLSLARDAVREKDFVILVEGYADLITVAQAGISNIVASSGTALTEDQIRLIDRYTKNVTLVYDADSAGSKAMLRGVDLIIEQGLDVRVIELPEGEDPDSFVKNNGGEAFQKLLDRAESFLDFKANYFRRLGMLASPEGKTRAIRSIVSTISRIHDELKRNIYVQTLAEKYSLPESVLFREVEALLGREQRVAQRPVAAPTQQSREPVRADMRKSPELVPASERDVLKVMLNFGEEFIRFVFSFIEPAMFSYPKAKTVADLLYAGLAEGRPFEASAFVDGLPDDDLKGFVSGLLMQDSELGSGWKKIGADPAKPDPWRIAEASVVAMRIREIDRLLEETNRQFKDAQSRGEDLHPLYYQLRQLQDEKRSLQTHGLPRQPEE